MGEFFVCQEDNPLFEIIQLFVALLVQVLMNVIVADNLDLPSTRCGIMMDVVDAKLDEDRGAADVRTVPIEPQFMREPIACLLFLAEGHHRYQKKHQNKLSHNSILSIKQIKHQIHICLNSKITVADLARFFYPYLFIQLKQNIMIGWRILLVALVVVVAGASSDLSYCSRSFTQEEWQEVAQSDLLNSRELQQHLHSEPYFLSKIFLMVAGKPQSLLELTGTAVVKIIPLIGSYLLICSLVLMLMLAFYFMRRKHEFVQMPLLSYFLTNKARTIKYLKIGIIFLLTMGAIFCLKGMSEGSRQEGAINHLLCSISNTRKYVQKNSTFISQPQLQDYLQYVTLKVYASQIRQFFNSKLKLRIAEYYKKTIQIIIQNLEGQQNFSIYQQLQNAAKTLHFIESFLVQPSTKYQYLCKQKAIGELHGILKHTLVIESYFDVLRKDKIQNFSINKFISNATFMTKAGFFILLLMIIMFGSLQVKNKWSSKHNVGLDFLSYAFCVVIALCFLTIVSTTVFLSFNFWIYHGMQSLINDPDICYNSFPNTEFKTTKTLCKVLSPGTNQTKYLQLSPFTSSYCRSYYEQFDQVVRPYLAKNDSYFYELMISSAQEIRNEASRRQIMEKIAAINVEVHMLPRMKNMHQHLAQALRISEEIQEQNINFTASIENLIQLLALHTANMATNIRKLCQTLSITFALILFLSSATKWLAEEYKNCGKQLSQINTNIELADFEPQTQNIK